MGCDIHAHVETRYIKSTSDDWDHLCDFRFGRNYTLFALMAGVRRYSYLPNDKELKLALKKRGVEHLNDPLLSEAETEVIVREASDTGITLGQPSFEEKGAPRDMSWKTTSDFTLIVVEDSEDREEEGCCTRSQATSWVNGGSSEVWDELDGKVARITHPDWHSASWLDTKEMEKIAERLRIINGANAVYRDRDASAKVEGLVEMMKRLEADGQMKARVVFWFDN